MGIASMIINNLTPTLYGTIENIETIGIIGTNGEAFNCLNNLINPNNLINLRRGNGEINGETASAHVYPSPSFVLPKTRLGKRNHSPVRLPDNSPSLSTFMTSLKNIEIVSPIKSIG
jgi:hypothetical protein